MATRYWEVIGHYNGESQNWEALAGTFQSSPFAPLAKGRLKGIRVLPGGEAATSLIEQIEFRLSCPLWTPNTITIGANGVGLRTVPASPLGHIDYEIDQPVEPGTGIAIEGRHAVATAVTNNTVVLGLFES